MKKRLLFFVYGLIFFVAVFFAQETASYVSTLVANALLNISPGQNLFANKFIHHIVQMLIALAVILPLKHIYKQDFGFKLGDKKAGILHVSIFSLILAIFLIIRYFYLYSTIPNIGYDYPVNSTNVLSDLAFQLFLSGPSEELLFRALPITLFIIVFKRSIKIKWFLTLEVLLAALLFSIAHLDSPKLDFQILYSFVLGIAYGVTYQKTGSILYPICMHSLSNILSVGLGYLFYILY